tara:strand:- start:12 stop:386 length:375 start_codon:yes stop_codon:yes gene_type:complete
MLRQMFCRGQPTHAHNIVQVAMIERGIKILVECAQLGVIQPSKPSAIKHRGRYDHLYSIRVTVEPVALVVNRQLLQRMTRLEIKPLAYFPSRHVTNISPIRLSVMLPAASSSPASSRERGRALD